MKSESQKGKRHGEGWKEVYEEITAEKFPNAPKLYKLTNARSWVESQTGWTERNPWQGTSPSFSKLKTNKIILKNLREKFLTSYRGTTI